MAHQSKWWFSIAMWVYERVHHWSEYLEETPNWTPTFLYESCNLGCKKTSNQCCAASKIETNRAFNRVQPEELSVEPENGVFFIPSHLIGIWKKAIRCWPSFPMNFPLKNRHLCLPLPWIWVCFQDLLPVRSHELRRKIMDFDPQKHAEKIQCITRIGF